jgi:hypothetical protein
MARLYDEFLARPERMSDPEVLPEVSQFFDPGVEIRQSASFLGTEGTFHGYDGLACSAREAFEVFRNLHWSPQGSSTPAITSWPPLRHAATAGTVTLRSRNRRPPVDASRGTDRRLARLHGPIPGPRSRGAAE